MTMTVDLNADMGESFGAWTMGDDAALLEIVTSANVACGIHAGDWDVMAATMRNAARQGVGVGAHPGLPDLQGFGRREMKIDFSSAANLVAWQVGAAKGMAKANGAELRHVKLHGALANMASRDEGLARACYEGALSVDPDLIVMVLAGTAQARAVKDMQCAAALEIFADRAYCADATLQDRSLPGAVIHDAEQAATRIVKMVRAGAIIAETGAHIETRIDTVCLHGDTLGAVEIARQVKAALTDSGVTVARFKGAPLG